MKSYSSREVIQILKADGWYEVNCEGDHHQFKHPEKKRACNRNTPEKRYSCQNAEKHRNAGRSKVRVMVYEGSSVI